MKTVKADVFTLNGEAWQVMLGSEILPATWNSKGAALAAIQTECRRRGVAAVNFRGRVINSRIACIMAHSGGL